MASATIQTVTGPISPADLGPTLMHEHLHQWNMTDLEFLRLKLIELLKIRVLELFLQVLVNAFPLHFDHPISSHLIFAFPFFLKRASVFESLLPSRFLASCRIF